MALLVTFVPFLISVIVFLLDLKIRKGQQLLAFVVALMGFLGSIVTCALPVWKVSVYVSGNIVTSQVLWEGLWMNCVLQSTGDRQCKAYDSLLALPQDLKAARGPMCLSIAIGVAAICLSVYWAPHWFTNPCRDEKITDVLVVDLAGIMFMVAGVLCIVPVHWSTFVIIQDCYDPLAREGRRGELGAAIHLGWVSGCFLFLGGGMLCSTYSQRFCCTTETKQRAGPLVKMAETYII